MRLVSLISYLWHIKGRAWTLTSLRTETAATLDSTALALLALRRPWTLLTLRDEDAKRAEAGAANAVRHCTLRCGLHASALETTAPRTAQEAAIVWECTSTVDSWE